MAIPPGCCMVLVLFLFFLRRMRKKTTPAMRAMPMMGPATAPAIHALLLDLVFLVFSGEPVAEAGGLLVGQRVI